MDVIYTTTDTEYAEAIALQLNESHAGDDLSYYAAEELAKGIWRVARVFRRNKDSDWERESVALPSARF
jgi:hypothetical protein